ncbi:MAG: radical SAM/SPASM domain-containing protein [Thermincolia bacterium]
MRAEKKPILGLDRVRLADVVPLRTPFTLNIFPTNACNFRCKYCIQSLGVKELKEKHNFTTETMDYDLFLEIIDQAKVFPDKFKLISMMGHGEPLCNNRLPEMISHAKSNEVAGRIEVITNGALLSKEISLALINAGLDCIRISLQGISGQKYKEIADVSINFDKFVDNLRFFYEKRRNCQLFVKIANIALEPEEEETFYRIFGDICDRIFVEQIMPVYSDVDYSGMVQSTKVDRYGTTHEGRLVCPLSFYQLGIWPNGDVAPCDAFYQPVILGNVKNDNLFNMWNGDKMRQFRALQLRKERYNHEKCQSCCAPDDVSQPEDVLDEKAPMLLKHFI